MKKPEPEIGQIIRFDYLWRDEASRGRIEGAKDRPCAVILAAEKKDDGTHTVFVAPITHTPPHKQQPAIEISSKDRGLTGLDDERSWLITAEVNKVDWSDAGIVPARKDQWLYGHLPRGVARNAVNQVVELNRQRLLERVDRTDYYQDRYSQDTQDREDDRER